MPTLSFLFSQWEGSLGVWGVAEGKEGFSARPPTPAEEQAQRLTSPHARKMLLICLQVMFCCNSDKK